ncbi:glycosyltransferase family 2 protein, partial [candidate division KSB1 bacterium]
MSRISVIIVTYNNEDTIKECLESVASDVSVHGKEII